MRFSSILDNDLYKFTMQHAVVQLFPHVRARYGFINRGAHSFPEGFAAALQQVVDDMAGLRLSLPEKAFLRQRCPYLPPTYVDFLEGYRYDPSEVCIQQKGENLTVTVEGYWYRTILWEVPLLAAISALYYETTSTERIGDEAVQQRAVDKQARLTELQAGFAEFGTRRRHSYAVHELVLRAFLKHPASTFRGTSNVHFAQRFDLLPVGTQAHEWFMFHGAEYGFKMANAMALKHWAAVYEGDLGIALTDTYTTDLFLSNFDKKLAKLFDGVRHDSGDPGAFIETIIRHYEQLRIPPRHKQIIFSDGLDVDEVQRIVAHADGRIIVSFGIGTDLTNDTGVPKMNIVMKLTDVSADSQRWISTIKLSDDPGKHSGDTAMIGLAKQMIALYRR